jgi:hypothetical protein
VIRLGADLGDLDRYIVGLSDGDYLVVSGALNSALQGIDAETSDGAQDARESTRQHTQTGTEDRGK